MIQTSLSPNTQRQDILLALSYLLLPWNWLTWRRGPEIQQLEEQFKSITESKYAVSFNSGREALYAALKAVDVTEQDEVILQPYTCIVVPHAILKCGAKPIYADVKGGTFNINPEEIAKKITKKTKAIIIQHTFGQAAEGEEIQELCSRHNIALIEDCAHTIGAEVKEKKLGAFGDIAIYSFGRDKVVSAVWGGMLTTNNKELHGKAEVIHAQAHQPSRLAAFQSIMHPLVFFIVKPLYNIIIGKIILVGAQKLGIINKVISTSEKSAQVLDIKIKKMNNINAIFAKSQLKRLKHFNAHRLQLSQQYQKLLSSTNYQLPTTHSQQPNLRYPILTESAHQVYNSLLSQGIQLGNWYHNILEPKCDPSLFGYTNGSCPNAEELCDKTLNLPLHIQMRKSEIKKLLDVMNHKSNQESLQQK